MLAWVDRAGVLTPIPAPPRTYDDVDVSPDGAEAVVTFSDDGAPSLHLYDLARSDGQVSPNGRWLVYTVTPSGTSDVFMRPFPNVNGDRVQVSVELLTQKMASR